MLPVAGPQRLGWLPGWARKAHPVSATRDEKSRNGPNWTGLVGEGGVGDDAWVDLETGADVGGAVCAG